jgi:hypothetical protein
LEVILVLFLIVVRVVVFVVHREGEIHPRGCRHDGVGVLQFRVLVV